LAGKDKAPRALLSVSGERRVVESDCPVAAGITPDADGGSTDDVFCAVEGLPEGGCGVGASVGLSPGASGALPVCDGD
jgi:hypothetical protein